MAKLKSFPQPFTSTLVWQRRSLSECRATLWCAPALHANFGLGWKWMAVANPLDYYNTQQLRPWGFYDTGPGLLGPWLRGSWKFLDENYWENEGWSRESLLKWKDRYLLVLTSLDLQFLLLYFYYCKYFFFIIKQGILMVS